MSDNMAAVEALNTLDLNSDSGDSVDETFLKNQLDLSEEPEQMSSVMQGININVLPEEMLYKIFTYLPLPDVVKLPLVCERWGGILLQGKSLLRSKRFFTYNKYNECEVRRLCHELPTFKCLHIVAASKTGLHISWPNALLFLDFKVFGRSAELERGDVKFETECLIACSTVFPTCLKWVCERKLRKMIVMSQCMTFDIPQRFTGPHDMYKMPECKDSRRVLTMCAFCSYRHHDTCEEQKKGDIGIENDEKKRVPRFDCHICHPISRATWLRKREDCPFPLLDDLTVACKFVAPETLRQIFSSSKLRTLKLHQRPCVSYVLKYGSLSRDTDGADSSNSTKGDSDITHQAGMHFYYCLNLEDDMPESIKQISPETSVGDCLVQ